MGSCTSSSWDAVTIMSMTFYILKYVRNILFLVAAILNCSAVFDPYQCFLSYAEHFLSLTCVPEYFSVSHCIWSNDELCAIRAVLAENASYKQSCVAYRTDDNSAAKVVCSERDGRSSTSLVNVHRISLRQYRSPARNGFRFSPRSFYRYNVMINLGSTESISVVTDSHSCQLKPDSRLFPRLSFLDSIGQIEIVHPVFKSFSPLGIVLKRFGIDIRSRPSFEIYASQSHLISRGASTDHIQGGQTYPVIHDDADP